MNVTGFVFNLNSAQPEVLQKFYRELIGLKPNPDMGEGALTAATTPFIIDGHSDLSGPAKEPARTLMNFQVGDVHREKSRLEAAGVRFLGPPSDDPISFATFVDPDGNYGQIFSMEGAPPGEMFGISRHSADPDRLRDFLRNVVGLSDDHPDIGNPFLAGGTVDLRRRAQRDTRQHAGTRARHPEPVRRRHRHRGGADRGGRREVHPQAGARILGRGYLDLPRP